MTIRDFPNNKERQTYIPHYYGDAVRVMFIVAGIIMLITFPFFNEIISIPTLVSPIVIIALSVAAGLMNPKQTVVISLNVIVSILAFLLLEYHAYYAFLNLDSTAPINAAFFWVSQILSLLFFFTTYLSVKTLRGRYVKKIEEEIK